MNFSDQYVCMHDGGNVNIGVKNVDKYYPGLGVKYNSSLLMF